MAATNNPLEDTHSSSSFPTVSATTFTIAGIIVTVHGLSELPPSTQEVACLWLLHPRLQTAQTMAPLANQIISTHNARKSSSKGLIAVAFDQRNHGTRCVDKLHNEAWRSGNPRHAQDMFSCYHGTATDVSQLIDHLESYILHTPDSPPITTHLALGISLGGHATWHCLLSDPRITAGVVGIGCPDYTRLMADRARLSKRPSYIQSHPPGAHFLGSPDFPPALQNAVAQYDPAGLLLPTSFNPVAPDTRPPSPHTLDRFKRIANDRLHGKHILNLSGGADKLVPYAAGEPFLSLFKQILHDDASLQIHLEDIVFDGVGHAFSTQMADKATSWICDLLARERGREGVQGGVASKI
ncbi:hypothetical protein IAQ61_003177 [Plenodomus lingam]|uniref:AB hydrolase-1 domain-containing protein n=1 Tax=Leptosphaeria maculans (strain JN3 / isolate v23.1.3 / race Av1-4-5-6-7-8) TaxID=985895 RepID=E5ADQ7_LEPMJ|nr:hypothetical protein LEMA_P001330.1 [Plenodomus lingam JN3]KAH9875713.1 hypothetical protein IAQ61_003177 [Plenodomus lingam]CBY01346.1 hypothetical protein LEMA_P001330.1 [Plenodomus lingam JN3]